MEQRPRTSLWTQREGPRRSGTDCSRPLIDLHCHILPTLDDGAIDLEDSVAMARQAESDGIAVVCATPHIRPDHEVAPHELESRVAAVNAELERQGIATRVAVGGEVAEDEVERLDDETLRRVSLGGAGIWLLIEPKAGPLSDTLHAHRRAADRAWLPDRHRAPGAPRGR